MMTRTPDQHHDDTKDTPLDPRLRKRIYALYALWVRAADADIRNEDEIRATGAALLDAVVEAKR